MRAKAPRVTASAPNAAAVRVAVVLVMCPKLDEDHWCFERQNNRWPNLHPKMPDRTIRPVKPQNAAQGIVVRESGIVV
jgi:hypothetical protein